jgi:hypothetical protein
VTVSDSLRRLDPIEFRKQYEGTFPAPEPLADEELAKIAHKYRDHAIIRTLVDDAVAQRHLNTTLAAQLVERDAEVAALREACTVAMGYIVRSDWTGTDARKALFALEVGYNPAPPTANTIPDRDDLGREVRAAWVSWAERQPNPKPSWLAPYDDLSEPDKEADRIIGERLYRLGMMDGPPTTAPLAAGEEGE